MAYKLKEAQDKVNAKNKAFDSSEKSRKKLLKKVEEEVSASAKAEADATRVSKVVDTIQKLPNTLAVRDKSKINVEVSSSLVAAARLEAAIFSIQPSPTKMLTATTGWQADVDTLTRSVDTSMTQRREELTSLRGQIVSLMEILLIYPAGRK
jgi:hypothetical protein